MVQLLFEDHEGLNRNTDLGVDLKTFLLKDRIAQLNKSYVGNLTRDEESHFTFVEENHFEAVAIKVKRNPIVYQGDCINLHKNAQGKIYPIFNRPQFLKHYQLNDFLRKAVEELNYLIGLVEEKASTK